MHHTMTLTSPWFGFVASGLKTVELRVHDAKRQRVRRGDTICFRHAKTGLPITRTVERVSTYPSFRAALGAVGLEHALPRCRDLDAGVETYEAIQGYAEGVRTHGVVAIALET